MDWNLALYELGSVGLVLSGFLIRTAMEQWKNARVAEALHRQRVEAFKRENGLRRRRVYTMRKRHNGLARFPWPQFERKLRQHGRACAVYENGRWRGVA